MKPDEQRKRLLIAERAVQDAQEIVDRTERSMNAAFACGDGMAGALQQDLYTARATVRAKRKQLELLKREIAGE